MATTRGSIEARGSCHLVASPPGLNISESDPESATVSRERRRVHMAARELGKVVNDELVALRLQVTTLQQLVETVFEKVSMFVPIIPVPVAKPHQYMAASPTCNSEDEQRKQQQQQQQQQPQVSVEPEHELSPQRFSEASIPPCRPSVVDAGRELCFDIFDVRRDATIQTDEQAHGLTGDRQRHSATAARDFAVATIEDEEISEHEILRDEGDDDGAEVRYELPTPRFQEYVQNRWPESPWMLNAASHWYDSIGGLQICHSTRLGK